MPEAAHTIEAGRVGSPGRRCRVPAALRVDLLIINWLTFAVLGLVALLRLVAWDSLEPLIVLDALTLIACLPGPWLPERS